MAFVTWPLYSRPPCNAMHKPEFAKNQYCFFQLSITLCICNDFFLALSEVHIAIGFAAAILKKVGLLLNWALPRIQRCHSRAVNADITACGLQSNVAHWGLTDIVRLTKAHQFFWTRILAWPQCVESTNIFPKIDASIQKMAAATATAVALSSQMKYIFSRFSTAASTAFLLLLSSAFSAMTDRYVITVQCAQNVCLFVTKSFLLCEKMVH